MTYKWRSIGHCSGCQRPCFLNDGEKYWELGTMCRCTSNLMIGHPVLNLKKIGFSISLIVAVFLTNDAFLRMVEAFFLFLAIWMSIWHFEGWMMVKFSDGTHPTHFDLCTVYDINPETYEVVNIHNYKEENLIW